MQGPPRALAEMPPDAIARPGADTAGVPELRDLLGKRLHRFVVVLPRLLGGNDSEAVHDLRVASRRLQQVVVTMFPKPRSHEARRIVRVLRRARRVVGGWRDCDVLIEMLEHRVKRVRSPQERPAWEQVLDAARKRRERELRRSMRKLANHRLFTLAQDVGELDVGKLSGAVLEAGKLTGPAPDQAAAGNGAGGEGAAGVLAKSISGAWHRWRDFMARAEASSESADLHAFRIDSKRLRYRIELARDLGAADCDSSLKVLKSLQDGLGGLHDRDQCALMAANVLANPDLLIRDPRAASLMLRRMAKERELERAAAVRILAEARAQSHRIERWVESYCAGSKIEPALGLPDVRSGGAVGGGTL
jgi:CHAD domain-containing protein